MGKARSPRRGSMQFWPRKRAKQIRVRSWSGSQQVAGALTFKAGMLHAMVLDNSPKSMTKGEKISVPCTVLECPPMTVIGVSSYIEQGYGITKNGFVFASDISKENKRYLSRTLSVPKKTVDVSTLPEGSFYRLLVMSSPFKTTIGKKSPNVMELPLIGSSSEQRDFALSQLGKDLSVSDIFKPGQQVDVHAVTKGKGFQGVIKRNGVALRSHKSEKGQRHRGNLGAWTPKRVDYRVAQPGKMGYHLRTEYNKQVVDVSTDLESVNPKSGFRHYGLVKNPYVLLKGSVAGPANRSVVITPAIRAKRPSAEYNVVRLSTQ